MSSLCDTAVTHDMSELSKVLVWQHVSASAMESSTRHVFKYPEHVRSRVETACIHALIARPGRCERSRLEHHTACTQLSHVDAYATCAVDSQLGPHRIGALSECVPLGCAHAKAVEWLACAGPSAVQATAHS